MGNMMPPIPEGYVAGILAETFSIVSENINPVIIIPVFVFN